MYVPSFITDEDGVQYPVKSVGLKAFSGNSNLVRIYFGEGIEELREQACYHCSNLESVSFPSTLRYFYNAFQECGKITKLEFPANLEYIGSSWLYSIVGLTGVIDIPAKVTEINITTITSEHVTGFNVAAANPNYKSVDGCLFTKDGTTLCLAPTSADWKTEYTTPDGVTTLWTSAFSNNHSLVTLTLSEGVVSALDSIGTCTQLIQLNLPSTLTTNPFQHYANLYSLSAITVSENSQTFVAVDGVLFTKDLNTLVKYPPRKEAAYIVPSTTKILGNGAFALGRVQSLTLNEGLLAIYSDALRAVIKVPATSTLNVLRIPNTVNSIANSGLFEAFWSGFEVDSSHPYYSTDGSVLYNKDKTAALVYTCDTSAPHDREVTLPSTVEEVGVGLAYNNNPLVKLDLSQTKITVLPKFTWFSNTNDGVERTLLLPSTLTRINYNSIRIVSAKTLTIPASVTIIESGAIGLDNAEEIIFEDPGQIGSDGVKLFNLTTFNSIFWVISPQCVVKGYKGTGGTLSPAEQIAKQYTLMFEPLD